MAALVVPLITTLAPVAIPLLVKLADKIFGSKTGAVKFQSVISSVQAIIQGMVTTGQISQAQVPTEAAIQSQVQAVVDDLNNKGELQGLGTALTPAMQPTLSTSDARMMLQVLAAVAPTLGAK